MSLLSEYALFLAKTVTVVAAVAAVLAIAATVGGRMARRGDRGFTGGGPRGLQVKNLNRRYEDLTAALQQGMLPAKAAKREAKQLAKARKAEAKALGTAEGTALGTGTPGSARSRIFVLDFTGDIRATQVRGLREEVSAIVTVARPGDEVLVRLSNPGGTVNDQGLAAAQLSRLRQRGVRLTVAVDTMAASGGYMMACVADRILAAPFAIVGSIGVVAQIPNVHRLLDRTGVDFEQFTGGEYKRTVTPFTRTTDEARAKLTSQIDDTHALFKQFVAANRPGLDIERVATGEYWYGTQALALGLVDELTTSDDYLLERCPTSDLFEVTWREPQSPARRLTALLRSAAPDLVTGPPVQPLSARLP